MAQYSANSNLTPKLYDEQLFRDSVKESYFSRFMGNTPNSVVQTKTQLEKGKGDSIRVGIRYKLTGVGVTEGQLLEGNEEALTDAHCDITLKQYRHAVRNDGEFTEQKIVYNLPVEMEQSLKDWASEKTDKLCFDELLTTQTKILYPTSATAMTGTGTANTAKAALTTSSLLNMRHINFVKTWAQTGGARTYIPLRPVKTDGGQFWILLVHPDCLFDLRVDSGFAQANREAMERGKSNPLFRDAVAVVGNVVIHEHENIPVGTDAGASSNVPWAKCALLGQQSLTFAWGKRGRIIKKDFDYGDKLGVAWSMICGVKKPIFDSKDYGSVGVYLARTNVSGS